MKTPNWKVLALALLWAQFPQGARGAPDPCKDADRILGGSKKPDSWHRGLLGEAELRARGHGDEVKGLDRVSGWLDLADEFRAQGDGWRDRHIPSFETLADEHLEFIRHGLVERFGKDFNPKDFNRLAEDAGRRRAEGSMTHGWWLDWNQRLALLYGGEKREKGDDSLVSLYLSRKENRISRTRTPPPWAFFHFLALRKMVSSFVNSFPNVVLLPVWDDGIGRPAFNRLFLSRLYPIGLTNRLREADESLLSPVNFMSHDVFHANLIERQVVLLEKDGVIAGDRLLHRLLLAELDGLSKDERNMVEDIFFDRFHDRYGDSGVSLMKEHKLASEEGMDRFMLYIVSPRRRGENEAQARTYAETLLRAGRRLPKKAP